MELEEQLTLKDCLLLDNKKEQLICVVDAFKLQ